MTVNRSCMRREIRDALVRRILEGKHAPGDRLLELQLAGEFHTSQAPVREALRELEALGYVETVTYRGTRVREIAPTEMRDSYLVRAFLEREAARAAAVRPGAEWSRMETAVTGIEAAAASGSIRGYVKHDEAFHRSLLTQSGNTVLLRHWELLLVPTRILVVLESGAVDMRRTAPEHRPILEALQAGEVERAGLLAHRHVAGIAERLEIPAVMGG